MADHPGSHRPRRKKKTKRKLTNRQVKKVRKVADAIKRDNPGISTSSKFARATAVVTSSTGQSRNKVSRRAIATAAVKKRRGAKRRA